MLNATWAMRYFMSLVAFLQFTGYGPALVPREWPGFPNDHHVAFLVFVLFLVRLEPPRYLDVFQVFRMPRHAGHGDNARLRHLVRDDDALQGPLVLQFFGHGYEVVFFRNRVMTVSMRARSLRSSRSAVLFFTLPAARSS